MPDKLFWQLQDSKRNWLYVAGIHAFFIGCNLSGLMLEYRNIRIRKQAGGVEGNRVSMSLEEGECITRMDILKSTRSVRKPWFGSITKPTKQSVEGIMVSLIMLFMTKLIEKQFHTNKNKRCRLQISPTGYTAYEDWQIYDFGDVDDAETLGPSSGGTLTTLSEKHGGRCVCIWLTMNVSPRATGVVERVGPILQMNV